jgi:small subunit ribosomal protein S17
MEKQKIQDMKEKKSDCTDKQCPLHGSLKLRGRSFKGYVIRKENRRIAIEFERIIYVKKFERQMKKRTKIHARLPDCMKQDINLGDYVEIRECRPLSKIIHCCVFQKIRDAEVKAHESSSS